MARKQLNNLVLLALFVGLIFLLGQTPLGMIPLGWCNVTLLVIPVAIGTIYMGLKSGLVLGLAFGATSMVSALIKPSVLVGTLMNRISYHTLFPYAGLFVALAFVTMLMVRHGDSKAEPARGIEAFDVEI